MDIPVALAKGAELAGSCTAVGCALLNFLGRYHDGMTTLFGFGGFSVALVGLSASIYFQHKRDKRERAEHDRRMAEFNARASQFSQAE